MKIDLDKRSRHFTVRDMVRCQVADELGLDNKPSQQAFFNILITLDLIDRLWDGYVLTLPEVVRPSFSITILHGYRRLPVNEALGGWSWSRHLRGSAADITLGSAS